MTVILKTDALNPDPAVIRAAARTIVGGGTVAFPTETVYGLGADALNESACRKIFEIKRRPADNPLIVHVADADSLNEVCSGLDEEVFRLARRVWPGPVTLVLPRSPKIPYVVTGGLETVAVRVPAHPVAQALIRESGRPIAAPSANLASRPSPTSARHVEEDLLGRVDVIIDGGETFLGVESTVVKFAEGRATVLRPGPFTVEDLGKLFSEVEVAGLHDVGRPIAPGMKYRHYAPRKPVFLVEGDLKPLIQDLLRAGRRPAVLCTRDFSKETAAPAIILAETNDLAEVAKNLFKCLRQLDKTDCEFGVIGPMPETGLGLAVMNRVRKACGGSTVRSAYEIVERLSTPSHAKKDERQYDLLADQK
ncbi:MAG: L-threonylcarbamoyladenylate synthase [Thermoprotei archaeon]